jgi:predicted Fe-Mo cluster-binding NifX family protein
MHEGRISPVLDVARRFLVLETHVARTTIRSEVQLENTEFLARSVVKLGWNVIVCGAVSRPLQALLEASGIKVVHNACGPVDEVLKAYFAGRLDSPAFLMPGCACHGGGRRRRRRGPKGRLG